MSQKTTSTKWSKRQAKLTARQEQYDREEWSDYSGLNRPGGTPNPMASTNPKVVFIKDEGGEQKAVGRIRDLGFGELLVGTKSILVKGIGSLGFWKAADYLVNFCGYKFTTAEN